MPSPHSPAGRVLAVDYGAARIGLAVSDELLFLAHPVETVPGQDPAAAVARIAAVVAEKRVGTVLIGLPLLMDGRESESTRRARAFGEKLRATLPPEIALLDRDERLTTAIAMEKLRAAGRTARNSRDRIDQAAACEILQEYLDANAGTGSPAFDTDNDDEWS